MRYFALYPFGASVHLFMNEFLDSKDSGTAILSHFYLLTGCANALWFEAPSQLISYTGVLVLGIGDALVSCCTFEAIILLTKINSQASIVGKRIGIHRWTPLTPKTTEGTAAFASSVVLAAWLLRLFGIAEPFSVSIRLVLAPLALLTNPADGPLHHHRRHLCCTGGPVGPER